VSLLFRALHIDPALSLLPTNVTINGVTKSPTARYYGKDAGASSWTASVGDNLPIASSGTAPTLDVPTPLPNSVDEAVTFNSGQVYRASDTAFCDIGAEDFFFEILFKTGAGAAVAKRGTGGYWELISNPITSLQFQLGDGVLTGASATINPGAEQVWVYVCGFFDLSDTAATGLRLNLDGGAQTATGVHAAYSSLTNTNAFTIGARSDNTQKFPSDVAYFALYKGADWFAGGSTNTTQWDAIAKERFHTLMGLAADNGALPSAVTRTTIARVDRVISEATDEIRSFAVGQGWPRRCKRKERTGGEYLTGILIEPQRTQILVQSQTFNNASWVKTALSVTADQAVSPDGSTTADALIADSTTAQHIIHQASGSLSAATHTFSVWAKRGDRDWLILEDTTLSNVRAWFNLNTGVVGTTGASVTLAHIEAWGNGWYRCSIAFTATAVSHTLRISPASADNTTDFTGDGSTVNTYIWGAQVENNIGNIPSTYIATTTATVTRAADFLQYAATGNTASSGRTVLKMLRVSNANVGAMNNNPYLVEFSTGAAERNVFYQGGNLTGNPTWIGVITSVVGASVLKAANIYNGEIHELEAYYAVGECKVADDGSFGTTVTSYNVRMPTAETGTIYVGNSRIGTESAGYIIADLRFYDFSVTGTGAVVNANDIAAAVGAFLAANNIRDYDELIVLPARETVILWNGRHIVVVPKRNTVLGYE
jgi:hypothetical protein